MEIGYKIANACAHCTEYANCGWSTARPCVPIPVERLTHGACENFCEPANFTVDDLDDDTAINIIAAIVKQATLDDDTKFLEKIRRYAYDRKRVVKSWVSP